MTESALPLEVHAIEALAITGEESEEGWYARPRDLTPYIRLCWLMLALLGAQERSNIVFLAFTIVFFGSKSVQERSKKLSRAFHFENAVQTPFWTPFRTPK